jgi:hypothetical protein
MATCPTTAKKAPAKKSATKKPAVATANGAKTNGAELRKALAEDDLGGLQQPIDGAMRNTERLAIGAGLFAMRRVWWRAPTA